MRHLNFLAGCSLFAATAALSQPVPPVAPPPPQPGQAQPMTQEKPKDIAAAPGTTDAKPAKWDVNARHGPGHVALAAIKDNGVDAEVIDLRTLVPLDIETIEESVKKTGRCLVVQEATKTSGFGAELATLVQERCFYHLEAPVERVAGWDTPYPHAYEWVYFPGPIRMKNALKKVLAA